MAEFFRQTVSFSNFFSVCLINFTCAEWQLVAKCASKISLKLQPTRLRMATVNAKMSQPNPAKRRILNKIFDGKKL